MRQEILRRLESKPPHYSHTQWLEERKRTLHYLGNISAYPERYIKALHRIEGPFPIPEQLTVDAQNSTKDAFNIYSQDAPNSFKLRSKKKEVKIVDNRSLAEVEEEPGLRAIRSRGSDGIRASQALRPIARSHPPPVKKIARGRPTVSI